MATFLTTSTGLRFTARRAPTVMVVRAAPTPRELKRLSDINDQDGLRFRVPVILVYRRRNASCDGRDPAAVIRDAIARALVHYYPLAGRLRELDGRKLAFDCTAEGVPFAEADADVRLDDFGDSVHPPLPCLEELLFDLPATSFIANSALVHIQVTRLACGGFVLAVQMFHTVADALGILQFLEAIAELARGAAAPTVHPVWARDLLLARDPSHPSFAHREYDDEVPPHDPIALPADALVQSFFFFRPRDVAAIRARLAPGLRERSTTFDVLTAFLWKCRTMALQLPDADEEVRLGLAVSACHVGGKRGLRLPTGYYGNRVVVVAAVSTAAELCANPVGYAVELVRRAKAEVDAEYIQSVADLMVLRGRPPFRVYLISDHTKVGFAVVDFGWGQPVHGEMTAMAPSLPRTGSVLTRCKNAKGEDGIFVPLWLPGRAMDRFTEEVGKLMRPPPKLSSL